MEKVFMLQIFKNHQISIQFVFFDRNNKIITTDNQQLVYQQYKNKTNYKSSFLHFVNPSIEEEGRYDCVFYQQLKSGSLEIIKNFSTNVKGLIKISISLK